MFIFFLCFVSAIGGSILTLFFHGELLSLYYIVQGSPAVPFDQEAFARVLDITMKAYHTMVAESLHTGLPVDSSMATKVGLRLEIIQGCMNILVKDISVYHYLPSEGINTLFDPSALSFSDCEDGSCSIKEDE